MVKILKRKKKNEERKYKNENRQQKREINILKKKEK